MNGLARQHGDRVECEVIPVDAPGAEARIARYGLFEHGIVLADAKDKVLWMEEGHDMTEAGIQTRIATATKGG